MLLFYMRLKLLIIIPAFNEAKRIKQVIDSIPHTIKHIKNIKILIVDDGSTDKTALIAKKANCLTISHSKNMGVGKTIQTGLEKAIDLNADIIVTIDADNQFNPKTIP